MEKWNYNNEKTERKNLNIMQKNQFLRVENSLLELEKDFIDLKDMRLTGRETKIKREIEELFFKPIFVSIEHKNRFEEEKKWRKRDPLKTFGMNG